MNAPDWRALFIDACKAFEAERPGIWLDLEFMVHVPELERMRERKTMEQLARKTGVR
jgi:hypothetical protein